MNNGGKSTKTIVILLLLGALSVAMAVITCADTPQSLVAPALAINISADDIPNADKQDATMNIYTCNNSYATCNSAAVLATTLQVGIDIRGNSSKTWDKKIMG